MNDAEERAAEFAVLVEPLRASLAGLLESIQAMRTRYNTRPAPDSKALREHGFNVELAGAWGDHPIESAQQWAGVLSVVAENHLLSICDLLALRRPVVFSTEVLGRAALEALARSAWLSELLIEPKERVRRWQLERLYSLKHGEHLDPKKARREREQISLSSKVLGIPVSLKDRPSATTLFGRLFLDRGTEASGNRLFRQQSATTHGTIFAVVQSFIHVSTDGHMEEVGISTNAQEANELLIQLIFGLVIATGQIAALFGWRDDDWQKQSANALQLARSIDEGSDRRSYSR